MPPAFVLSQDQTLKFCHNTLQHEPKPADRKTSNFGSRYLHLSNVMDTKDMSDIGLVTGVRGPKTLDTGRRRPHVPSSKLTMSKSRQTEFGGQPLFPDFCYRGTWCPTMLATGRSGKRWRPVPAGEAAYMEGVPARQRLSAFFLKQVANSPETRHFVDAKLALQILQLANRLARNGGNALNRAESAPDSTS